MKIYPRRLRFSANEETGEITIKNSSSQERILLFRVRRAAEKLLSFLPKKGYVLPGESATVVVKALNANFVRTRLLFRLTCVPVVDVEQLQDFEKAYHLGLTLFGEVKKIVDVYGAESDEHDYLSHRESESALSSVSRATSDLDAFEMSSASSTCSFRFSPEKIHRSRSQEARYALQDLEEVVPPVISGASQSKILTQDSDYSDEAFLKLLRSASKEDKQRLMDSLQSPRLSRDFVPSERVSSLSMRSSTASSGLPGDAALAISTKNMVTSGATTISNDKSFELSPTQSLRQSLESELNDLRELVEKASHSSVNNHMDQPPQQHSQQMDTSLAKSKKSSRGQSLDLSQVGDEERRSNHSCSASVSVQLSEESSPEERGHSENAKWSSSHAVMGDTTRDRDPSETSYGELYNQSKRDQHPDLLGQYRQPQVEDTAAPSDINGSDDDRAADDEQVSYSHEDEEETVNIVNHVLSLHGDGIGDLRCVELCEQALSEAQRRRDRIVSMKVEHCSLQTLAASVSAIFGSNSSDSPQQTSTKEQELKELRCSLFDDGLQLLSIAYCPLLTAMDDSLSRFSALTTLSITHCKLRTIEGALHLPLLTSLDLSNNLLKSLDGLQSLTALVTLSSCNNKLFAARDTTTVLVPLARTLLSVDLRGNSMCSEVHYCEAVLLALPGLTSFDGEDVDSICNSLYSNNANLLRSSLQRDGGRASAISSASATLQSQHMRSWRSNMSDRSAPPLLPYERERQRQREKSTRRGEVNDFRERLRRTVAQRVFQSSRDRVREIRKALEVSNSTAVTFKHKIDRLSSANNSERNGKVLGHTRTSRGAVLEEPWKSDDSLERDLEYELHLLQNREFLTQRENEKDTEQSKRDREFDLVLQRQRDLEIEIEEERSRWQEQQQQNLRLEREKLETEKRELALREALYQKDLNKSAIAHSQSVSREKFRLSAEDTHGSGDKLAKDMAKQSKTTNSAEFSFSKTETSSSKQRRKSAANSLISHWVGHRDPNASNGPAPTPTRPPPVQAHTPSRMGSSGVSAFANASNMSPLSSPGRSRSQSPSHRSSSLSRLTGSARSRRASFGIGAGGSLSQSMFQDALSFDASKSLLQSLDRGYHSDGDRKSVRGRAAKTLSKEHFEEMQEDPRYGVWNPRYRVPVPTFGFSKPFLYRSEPGQTSRPPLFDKTVQRIRDGFEKLPTRGTFTRGSKGLVAEWYPMDYSDCEAVRRQGFFHEVIGDIQKNSYRDPAAKQQKVLNDEMTLSQSGSVCLSPTKKGRRGSVGRHMSRQYQSADGRMESFSQLHTQPNDDFSSFRKWHTGQLDAEDDGAGGVVSEGSRGYFFPDSPRNSSPNKSLSAKEIFPHSHTGKAEGLSSIETSSSNSPRPASALSKLFPAEGNFNSMYDEIDREAATQDPAMPAISTTETETSHFAQNSFQAGPSNEDLKPSSPSNAYNMSSGNIADSKRENSTQKPRGTTSNFAAEGQSTDYGFQQPSTFLRASEVEFEQKDETPDDVVPQQDEGMISYLSWLQEQQIDTTRNSYDSRHSQGASASHPREVAMRPEQVDSVALSNQYDWDNNPMKSLFGKPKK